MNWRRDAIIIGAIIAGVWATGPADACHRYSIWKYPHPQYCGYRAQVRPVAVRRQPVRVFAHPAPAPQPAPQDWYVEVTKMPSAVQPLTDDQAHTLGVQMLKRQLGGSQ